MKLRNAIGSAVVAVGLGVGAVAMAPMALADEQSYLNDLAANGYTGSAGTYLGLGYGVCDGAAAGYSQAALTEAMYQNTGASIDHAEAAFIVESAEIFLC